MKTTAFFAFLGLAAATTVPSFLEDCPDSCPEIYAPVCASNGKQLKEFENECELRHFTCNHYKTEGVFKFLKDGDCILPKTAGRLSVVPGFVPECPQEWKPVCGFDGTTYKTYPNECVLDVLNDKEKTGFVSLGSGACEWRGRESEIEEEIDTIKDCPACPDVYDPVWASDGTEQREFPNECEVGSFNCNESRHFRVMGSEPNFRVMGSEPTEAKELPGEDEDTSKDCPSCPDVDDPVLATDGTEVKEFSNACEIESFNCYESRNFRFIGSKPSEEIELPSDKDKVVNKDCPDCLDVYASVWASDVDGTGTGSGTEVKEVANESSDFRARRSGPREEKDLPKLKTEEDCPPCKDVDAPVCASDGDQLRTFRNECEVESFNCFESTNFTKIKPGEC